MKHPGNISMRNMLEMRWEEYDAAGYSQKSEIAWQIVFNIQRFGGRFLKEHPDGWFMEVDDDDARRKISIALRDRVKKYKKNAEKKKPPTPSPSSGVGSGAVAPHTAMQPNATQSPVPSSGKHENDNVEFLDLSFQAGVSKRRKHDHDGNPECGPSSWFCGK